VRVHFMAETTGRPTTNGAGEERAPTMQRAQATLTKPDASVPRSPWRKQQRGTRPGILAAMSR
jgi:hypothetical protein